MGKSERSRGWCITVNNYSEADIESVRGLYKEDDNCTYLIIGYEEGTRKKTPHMQCYIYYTEKVSFNSMKKRVNIQGRQHHVEKQKASKNVEAYCYCMKDGNYEEYGERPRQGHRTDLEVIKHDIERGKPESEIEYFSQWCQYRKAFKDYRELCAKRVTKIMFYDKAHPRAQYRKIHASYKDFKIVTAYTDILELLELAESGKYSYIFVPNYAGYVDYSEEFDGDIYDD
ncbi:replication associated protein [Apis mellifera virus-15]|nr:replication associated protein [Apis mellifera virus-15]